MERRLGAKVQPTSAEEAGAALLSGGGRSKLNRV